MSESQLISHVARRARTLLSLALPQGLPPVSVAIVGVLALWLSVPIIASLNPTWQTDYYSHGQAVLVLTGLLFVLELRRAPSAPLMPSWTGFAWLVLLVLIAMASYASTTILIAQLALPLLWITTIWALAGARTARRFALPLGYLYVAVPIWDFLIEPSRRLTVLVLSSWIRAARWPAFIEGDLIHVPAGTFEVKEGCSGLKFILVAFALASLASLLQRLRWKPAAVLIISALILALFGNWLRIFITVAGGLSPENLVSSMINEHHLLFGWGVFVVAIIVPLFYLNQVLQSRSLTASAIDATVDLRPPRATSQRNVAIPVSVVLALAIWLTHRVNEVAAEAPLTVAFRTPEIAGWERTADWQDDARLPVFVGASAEGAAWYVNGAVRIGAYAAHYASQRQERELVFESNRPAGQSGVVVARRSATTTTASGIAIPFQELEVSDSADERRLVWVALRVAGTPAANDFVAKVLQVGGVIRGRSDAQALVLTARCDGGCAEARSWLSQYAMAAAEPLYAQAARSIGAEQTPHDADRGAR